MTILERINKLSNPDNIQKDMFGNVKSAGDSWLRSEKKYIVGSISGGRSSGLMAYILENSPMYKDYEKIYIFMNTGRESWKTIKFLKNIQDYIIKQPIHLIEAKVYHDQRKSSGYTLKNWDNLSMNGEPFEEVIKKYGLPSIETPHCSRELKINPINAFIKEGLGLSKSEIRQAIGIRIDEVRRYKNDPKNLIYPLIDYYITKSAVNRFWSEEFPEYDLEDFEDFEGNCDFCFKKSDDNLIKNKSKNPDGLAWWEEMGDKYDEGFPIYRNHKTAHDIRNNNLGKTQQLDCMCGNTDSLFFDDHEGPNEKYF